jgi:hypothetical protein
LGRNHSFGSHPEAVGYFCGPAASAGKIDVQGWCPVQADLGTNSEASKLSSWQRVLGGIHTDTLQRIHFGSMFDNKWYIIETV